MTSFTRSPLERAPATQVMLILLAGALTRFLLSATIGLGVDESYAVAVARQFSLSYFDHPPLHFWLAGAVARLARSESGPVVRSPFVLCFAGTTWLTFRLASRFFGERAGAIAALLLNVSAVFSLSTGGWVLPDGPLMLLMLASVLVISGILFEDASRPAGWLDRRPPALRWIVAGLLAGLAMLSKYHGVFVLGGTFLFLVTSPPHRKWLRHPGPWLGAAVAFACFTPVLIWNHEHGWVSFLFQGGRASGRGGLHPLTLLANIGGQAAWVLPWIWVPLVATLVRAVSAGPRDAGRWFFVCLALGPVVGFTLVSLRGDVGLPHWQAPGYLMLFPPLGAAVTERLDRGDVLTRRWLRSSVWGFLALVVILATQTATGWMERVIPGAFTRGDPTTDAVDWRELRPALDANGLLASVAFVAAPSWIQAGKAAVGLGPDVPVLCLCADPHQFRYLYDDRLFLGGDAILVKKIRSGDDVVSTFGGYFASIVPVDTVVIHRAGQEALRVGVWRATRFQRLFPTAQPR